MCRLRTVDILLITPRPVAATPERPRQTPEATTGFVQRERTSARSKNPMPDSRRMKSTSGPEPYSAWSVQLSGSPYTRRPQRPLPGVSIPVARCPKGATGILWTRRTRRTLASETSVNPGGLCIHLPKHHRCRLRDPAPAPAISGWYQPHHLGLQKSTHWYKARGLRWGWPPRNCPLGLRAGCSKPVNHRAFFRPTFQSAGIFCWPGGYGASNVEHSHA